MINTECAFSESEGGIELRQLCFLTPSLSPQKATGLSQELSMRGWHENSPAGARSRLTSRRIL